MGLTTSYSTMANEQEILDRVANALDEVGVTPDSELALAFNKEYDDALKWVLGFRKWDFNRKTVRLDLDSSARDEDKYPWKLAFHKPGDYLDGQTHYYIWGYGAQTAQFGYRSRRQRITNDERQFDIDAHEQRGEYFLFDYDNQWDLEYSTEVPVDNINDDKAITLLILDLAVKLVDSATGDEALKADLQNRLGFAMSQAKQLDHWRPTLSTLGY